MLLMISDGRLGNQLFQLNALEAARRNNEIAVLTGFREALPQLHRKRTFRLARFGLSDKNLRILESLGEFLVKIRLIGAVTTSPGATSFSRKHGFLPVFVFTERYFQGWEFINNANRIPEVLQQLFATGEVLTPRHQLIDNTTSPVFVHVRRGDYLDFPKGTSSSLPVEWYLGLMEEMRVTLDDPHFYVVSDEPDFCRHAFPPRSDISVVDSGSAVADMALMAHCKAGILSASSFSWWAARAASNSSGGPFYAPRGWLNWHGKAPGSSVPAADFLVFKHVELSTF